MSNNPKLNQTNAEQESDDLVKKYQEYIRSTQELTAEILAGFGNELITLKEFRAAKQSYMQANKNPLIDELNNIKNLSDKNHSNKNPSNKEETNNPATDNKNPHNEEKEGKSNSLSPNEPILPIQSTSVSTRLGQCGQAVDDVNIELAQQISRSSTRD